jgi:formylglycine-generating enzyme required for sulfatase activity
MSDAFISYRRKPSASLARLIQSQFKERYGLDAYLDTTRADSSTVQFPDRLMKAIEESPTFICLLGDETLDSDWVRKEIQRAYELGKPCIPVFQESYVPPTDPDAAINYLLNFDGVHVFDIKNVLVEESIAKIADLVVRKRSGYSLRLAGMIALAVLFVVGFAAAMFLVLGNPSDGDQTPTQAEVAQQATETSTDEPTKEPSLTPTDKPTETATNEPTSISGEEAAATLVAAQASQTADAYTDTPSPSPTATTDFTATVEALAALYNTGTENARQTETAESWTDTPTPTFTPSLTPTLTPTTTATLPPGFEPMTRNADWTPIEQDFDGVTMVLVPAGCFMMGNDPQAQYWDGSKWVTGVPNGGEQCFDAPFWIDKTEVTQAQFVQFSGEKANANAFSGDNHPVERVTWYEAWDFCEQRDGRLPSESEWEYATRGPDNLIYPWGDEWSENSLVWSGNSDNQTADIGSRTGGVSWVGAYDLSGNVWEWVSTIYGRYDYNADLFTSIYVYPYQEGDGREIIDDDNTKIRVLRGDSWYNSNIDYFRAAVRYWFNPSNVSNDVGFRCARNY